MEYINLNGYGYFVWPAFIFAFLSCFLLYFKTRKEFRKTQKIFLIEFHYEKSIQKNFGKRSSVIKDTFPKRAIS